MARLPTPTPAARLAGVSIAELRKAAGYVPPYANPKRCSTCAALATRPGHADRCLRWGFSVSGNAKCRSWAAFDGQARAQGRAS